MIKDVKGFTLLELMIAVSLGVILLGIGAPAMSRLLNENTLQFESRTVLKYLRFARSQAVDNQQSVTACLANSSDSCVQARPTQLLVFIDNDNNKALGNGEQLLAKENSFPTTLTASNNQDRIVFSPDGTSMGFNGTLSLCSPKSYQINIITASSGRSYQSTQTNICP